MGSAVREFLFSKDSEGFFYWRVFFYSLWKIRPIYIYLQRISVSKTFKYILMSSGTWGEACVKYLIYLMKIPTKILFFRSSLWTLGEIWHTRHENTCETNREKCHVLWLMEFVFFFRFFPPQKFAEMQKSVLYGTGFKLFKSYTFKLFNLMSLQW